MATVDATDVRIYLPVSSESETLVPVVHIFDAQVSLETESERSVKPTSGKWSRTKVIKLMWSIAGSSHCVYYPGHSFRTLSRLWRSRSEVPCRFEMLGEHYSGNVVIQNVRTSGSTGQTVALTFNLAGQDEFNEVTNP